MIYALAVVEKNTKNAMVKQLKLMLFITCAFAYTQASAQVILKIDETINEQLRMKNARIDTTKVSGYRIQIAHSQDGVEAKNSLTSFQNKFTDKEAYLLYQSPYWKVRVGDFYREIDAQKLLDEIRIYFPDAFVVKDHIRRPKI